MKKIFTLISFICLFCMNTVFANDLNLYENPDAKAKVVTTLKSGEQIMPIYSPANSEWIKVANPKDGAVGWAKIADLKGPVITVITSNGGDNSKGQQFYQIQAFGGVQQIKPEEAEKMIKDIELRGQKMKESLLQMQSTMQKEIENMMKDISSNKNFLTFPIIQPVIIVPENK